MMTGSSDRKNAALIVPGFSSHAMDSCLPVLNDLVKSLSRHLKIRLFALHYPFERREYRLFGADIIALGGRNKSGIHRAPLISRALLSLIREHRRSPFDLVHGFFADEPGAIAAVTGRLLRIPSLLTIMGGEGVALPEINYGGMLSRTNYLLLRFAMRNADFLTAGSSYAGHQFQFLTDRSIRSVPLGVDTALFRPSKTIDRSQKRLLHVGSLARVKNQRFLIEAFSRVASRRRDITLDIVGEGDLRRELEEYVHRQGLDNRVTFHGQIPRPQLVDWYRRAALVIVSSIYESQSLVALEAAACETPVAGTAVGILPELLPDRFCVASGDCEKLSDIILDLMEDTRERRALGAFLLNQVRKSFRLETTIQKFLELYQTGRSRNSKQA